MLETQKSINNIKSMLNRDYNLNINNFEVKLNEFYIKHKETGLILICKSKKIEKNKNESIISNEDSPWFLVNDEGEETPIHIGIADEQQDIIITRAFVAAMKNLGVSIR